MAWLRGAFRHCIWERLEVVAGRLRLSGGMAAVRAEVRTRVVYGLVFGLVMVRIRYPFPRERE